ncbi:unnamed protein product, partial [Amoebophrya sp. A120]|eukprot:GSA120T00002550001.1
MDALEVGGPTESRRLSAAQIDRVSRRNSVDVSQVLCRSSEVRERLSQVIAADPAPEPSPSLLSLIKPAAAIGRRGSRVSFNTIVQVSFKPAVGAQEGEKSSGHTPDQMADAEARLETTLEDEEKLQIESDDELVDATYADRPSENEATPQPTANGKSGGIVANAGTAKVCLPITVETRSSSRSSASSFGEISSDGSAQHRKNTSINAKNKKPIAPATVAANETAPAGPLPTSREQAAGSGGGNAEPEVVAAGITVSNIRPVDDGGSSFSSSSTESRISSKGSMPPSPPREEENAPERNVLYRSASA